MCYTPMGKWLGREQKGRRWKLWARRPWTREAAPAMLPPLLVQPLKHSSVGKYMVPIHTPATETYCYLKDLLYDNGSLYLGHLVPFSQRPLGSLRQCQWWWVLGV